MTSPLFRNRAIRAVENALKEFRDIADVKHPGIQGRICEIAIENCLSRSYQGILNSEQAKYFCTLFNLAP
jgi:hypothetical protein